MYINKQNGESKRSLLGQRVLLLDKTQITDRKEIVAEGRDVMIIEGGLMEKPMEWFRPLVDSTVWDYCVIWKLGDDPSRFIEWMGCFCSGANGGGGGGGGGGGRVTVKEESIEEAPLCRDVQFKHPMRTKACEALARFPFFLPLYSGIQGEVVISRQPKWLTNTNASDSNSSSLEQIGTRVLIPVIGGLIELFASKAMEKDQTIIELIAAQFRIPLNPTVGNDYPSLNLNDYYVDASLKEELQNLPPTSHLFSFLSPVKVLPQSTQPHNQSSFEGSSSGSINPVKEHSHSGHVPLNECSTLSVGKFTSSRKSNCNQNLLIPDGKQKIAKATRGSGRERYKSKNLEVERKRRIRIKEGLFALRGIVPKISKMDKASILGDAIEYIIELQNEKKKLEDELKQTEEGQWRNDGLETSVLETLYEGSRNLNSYVGIQGATGFGEKLCSEVELQLNQITERDFWIKLVCEHKRGGFRRLMEVLHASGLHVLDANIATSWSKDLNILHVEAHEHVEAKELREALIRMTMTE